jgi:type VI protein secretion system component VasK
MPIIHGRHIGPLIMIWVIGLSIAAGLYWLQATMLALVDMITPLYIIVGVGIIVGTWKWFRERGQERRHRARRHGDRREPEIRGSTRAERTIAERTIRDDSQD